MRFQRKMSPRRAHIPVSGKGGCALIFVRRRAGHPTQGILWTAGLPAVRCALGRGGVITHKREGDGGTPRGRFPLRRLWVRPDGPRWPRSRLPTRRTRKTDGWCDAVGHRRYNKPVPLPFSASHERMWRDDALYDAVIEIGWNDHPARAGRGSAIFLHLARPGCLPTEGCVAVSPATMQRLLPNLSLRTRIDIQ